MKKQIDLEKRKWKNIDLPHDWSVRQQLSPTWQVPPVTFREASVGIASNFLFLMSKKAKKYICTLKVFTIEAKFLLMANCSESGQMVISLLCTMQLHTLSTKKRIRHCQGGSQPIRWFPLVHRFRYLPECLGGYANPVHIEQWGVYAFPEKKKNDYLG